MKIILASKSGVRKNILENNKIDCTVILSNVDEDEVKESMLKENATPKLVSKNLAELSKLNGKKHKLISSVCISKNGSMIWNYTDSSNLTMKQLNLDEIKSYLNKIKDKELYAYGVYQIEADGRDLFEKIEGDEDTIMGLPVKQIKVYLDSLK